ncbi:MAG: hypothetical protein OHK0017_01530 [Patescibacteria group bacterium]
MFKFQPNSVTNLKHNTFKIVNSFILILAAVFASLNGGIVANAQTECQITNPQLANFGPRCIPLINTLQGSSSREGVTGIILQIADVAIFVLTAIAVLMIVYAGFLFVIDGGSGEKAGKGKKIIVNAIIGIVIAIASYTIVSLIVGAISNLDLSATGSSNSL